MGHRYENRFRGMCLDFCFPDPPLAPLDKLDIEEVKRAIREARLDNYQMFCKSHWGTAAYDTKIGKKHPGLKVDYVGELREFLQEEDIKFTAYYSVGFDEHIIRTHPEWAARDENGEMISLPPGADFPFHWVCTNTPYRQYALGQLEEIIRGYQPDGVFLDIVSQPVCYCSHCQDSFRKKYVRDIPGRANQEKYWRELLDLRDRIVLLSFMQDVTNLVQRLRPEMILCINGGPFRYRREMLDLTSFDFAEHHASGGLWDACWRGIDPNNMPMVGVSTDPYDPYPTASIITSGVLSVAQNALPNFGSFAFKPDGTLNELEFENVGRAFEEIQRIEPWLRDRESVKSLGIVYSESTRLYDDHDVICQLSEHCSVPFREGLEGALELCNYSKYPFDTIAEEMLLEGDLSQYEALILPNVACMSGEVAGKIREYVRDGGVLVATHRTSLKDEKGFELPNFGLADVFGCDLVRIRDEYAWNVWGSFLHRREHPVWEGTPVAEFGTHGSFVETRGTSGQVLATHTLPLAAGTALVSPFLPPSEVTAYPAIQVNRYGQGVSVYFSFDFLHIEYEKGGGWGGAMRLKWPRRFFVNLLRELLPSPKIRNEVEAPEALTISYYRRKGENVLIIHQVNDSVIKLGGAVVPVSGGTIVVAGDYMRPVRARAVHPEEVELRIEKADNVYRIATPMLDIHSIMVIEGQ